MKKNFFWKPYLGNPLTRVQLVMRISWFFVKTYKPSASPCVRKSKTWLNTSLYPIMNILVRVKSVLHGTICIIRSVWWLLFGF